MSIVGAPVPPPLFFALSLLGGKEVGRQRGCWAFLARPGWRPNRSGAGKGGWEELFTVITEARAAALRAGVVAKPNPKDLREGV